PNGSSEPRRTRSHTDWTQPLPSRGGAAEIISDNNGPRRRRDPMLVNDARELSLEPGESRRVWLGVGSSWFGPVRIPLYVARGRQPGPKLVAIACQHGDEVYGVLGILDLMNAIRGEDLRGELWLSPCLNVH